MIELALALPLLVFGLVGGIDMARAYAVQLAVQNGARAAAEGTALDATPTSLEAVAHAQQEMDRTPGLASGSATITVAFAQVNGTTPCVGALNTATAGASTIAAPCYAFVRVRYTFSTLIPWPGLRRSFNFDRSTTFRRYQ